MPAATREAQDGRTLLDICLDVHMSVTGAYARSSAEVLEDFTLLQRAMDNWEPSVHSPDFDQAVWKLIDVTICEAMRKGNF